MGKILFAMYPESSAHQEIAFDSCNFYFVWTLLHFGFLIHLMILYLNSFFHSKVGLFALILNIMMGWSGIDYIDVNSYHLTI